MFPVNARFKILVRRYLKWTSSIGFLAHLAHSANVSFCDSPMSYVRRRVSCVVRRASSTFSLNDISSETTGQNFMKLEHKHPWVIGNKRYRTEF